MPKKEVPAKAPKPKFVLLGKSKYVHTVRTKVWDLKNSGCQQVRKFQVADKVPKKSLSEEAASALDSCPSCCTAEVIALNQTPDQKRAERKDKRDEVLARARGRTGPVMYKGGQRPKTATSAKEIEADAKDRLKKHKKASMTKYGPRSVASSRDGDPTKTKAQILADFGTEHGWTTEVKEDKKSGHTVVTAKRGQEVITAWFIDGKYDINRHAEVRAGNWVGKLRGAHACRRQMAGEGRDRIHPEPGKGRSGPRKREEVDVPEDESPEDAFRRVPFSLDDPESAIIDAIKGKVIKWRNGVSGVLEEAWLPSTANGSKREKICITAHPKTGRRMVDFLSVASIGEHGEVYGPERTVYLDKIVRVVE